MEILQPQGYKDLYRSVTAKNPILVVNVTPVTEALLKSFASLSNNDHVDQRNVYMLPKVAEVPTLNKVMARRA